jgi:hypothetical protein
MLSDGPSDEPQPAPDHPRPPTNILYYNLYNLYKDLIPKQYKYLKYIKASKKVDYKPEEVEAVQIYFEVSKKEAKEYINMLPKDELEIIISQINGKM